MSETMIETVSWNPRRKLDLPFLRRFEWGPRVNNFGDLLGPTVVDLMLQRIGRTHVASGAVDARGSVPRLFSVGSILHMARDNDVVWGTGINGKVRRDEHVWSSLDVRATRGPRSRAWIREFAGIDAPEVYGDPALLLFELGLSRPERTHQRTSTMIPNLNDKRARFRRPDAMDPRRPLSEILAAIASSEWVVTSSLHGLIIAEMLEVPVALLTPHEEPPFKYLDYAEGTGRTELPMFEDLAAAERYASSPERAGEKPLSAWSPEPLITAFPSDLYSETVPDAPVTR